MIIIGHSTYQYCINIYLSTELNSNSFKLIYGIVFNIKLIDYKYGRSLTNKPYFIILFHSLGVLLPAIILANV